MRPNRSYYQDMVRAATVREVDRFGAWLNAYYATHAYHASETGRRPVTGFRLYAERARVVEFEARRSA